MLGYLSRKQVLEHRFPGNNLYEVILEQTAQLIYKFSELMNRELLSLLIQMKAYKV